MDLEKRWLRSLELTFLPADLKITDEEEFKIEASTWREWVDIYLPDLPQYEFANHHRDMWVWAEAMKPNLPHDPLVAIFAREGAKSSNAEAIAVYVGQKRKRKFILYVCETQDQADDHIESIAELLESDQMQELDPALSSRRIGKYGRSRGWRRNRISTAAGVTYDALGLDKAKRGIKLGQYRPDFIIFDDVDGRHDTLRATKRKIEKITESILPSGTVVTTSLWVQNLIHRNSVFSQLASGKADFILNRKTVGPIPALLDFKYEAVYNEEYERVQYRITSGTPTWVGQDVAACERFMNTWGSKSFKRECQHDVYEVEGTIWTQALIDATRVGTGDLPVDAEGNYVFRRIIVGVDPSGGGDAIGIIAAALGHNGHCYVLRDGTQPGSAGPRNWGRTVILLYDELGADRIVAEKNFGGDLVKANIRVYSKRAPVEMVHASRGKAVRAEPVEALYEEGLVHHVGVFPDLEAEMTSWLPDDTEESPNRMDALVWAVTELMLGESVFTGGAGVIPVNRGRR